MFVDAGDLWVMESGANYKIYWNKYGMNLQSYRDVGQWDPVFYRHNSAANIAFFDGHVEYRPKQEIFFYYKGLPYPDNKKNSELWFINPANLRL